MDLTISAVAAKNGVAKDHRLRITPQTEIGAMAEVIAGSGHALYLGPRKLDPTQTLTGSGIRDGALLGVDGPVRAREFIRLSSGRGPFVAEIHAVSGPEAGQIWRLAPGSHEIGSDPLCAIRLTADGVPVRHLWVTVCADGSVVWQCTAELEEVVEAPRIGPPADDAATSAVRVQLDEHGHPIEHAAVTADAGGSRAGQDRPADWPPGEDLAVGPVLLRLGLGREPAAAVRESADGFGLDYNRPPRLAPHLDEESIRLPASPGGTPRQPFPWPMIISPLILGLVMVGIFKSYYFLAFTALSPVMMISNWQANRKNGRRQHRETVRRHQARIAALETEIGTAVARERRLRDEMAPDPVRIARLATGPGSRLWERRLRDEDHLMLRLGTADQSSVKQIHDQSREDNHQTIRWQIPDAPVVLDLPALGVAGIAGDRRLCQAIARWLVIQSAVLHSPTQLRIVVLTRKQAPQDWAWVRWLPHLRSERGAAVTIGNDQESIADRIGELVSRIQARQRLMGAHGEAPPVDHHVLLIADDSLALRDVPGFVQVLTDGPAVGIHCVCLEAEERLLPEESRGVMLASGDQLTLKQPGTPDLIGIRVDQVSPAWCEQVARALTPVRDVSPDQDAGLPHRVRLLELIGQEPPSVDVALAQWQRRPASTSFTLGRDFDGPLRIDLVADGPHSLIAGTTGSGKSELLQTLVISLAACNRPDELTFVLIDYKGGSAFQECAGLPHTLGMVTDLDAHQVERALVSLDAELRRRERVLAAAGAKDLPDYQSMRSVDRSMAPLPRLVLVIDEFAAMVAEIPDFVPGLISIAQRGRSLGIHLVLATQRPAGVVTADIRANTNLRIALRMTDQTESQDVIETNEAASIPTAIPGRALIRRGPRTADLFQTAWVGAERKDPAGGLKLVVPAAPVPVEADEFSWDTMGSSTRQPKHDEAEQLVGPPADTDLRALVAVLREAAAQLPDFEPQPSPWKEPLHHGLTLDDLPDCGDRELMIPYALEDLPQLQDRRTAGLDLTTFGHLYVIGAPQSGRTQFLRTLAGSAAGRLSCADVHLYGIDAAGGGLTALAHLPHCGTVVSRHDMERLERLLRRLNRELTQRQELATRHNATGLTELRSRLPAGERPAHLLIMIDGWDALATQLEEYDHGNLLQETTRLLREGAGVGIHVVATSERSLLGGRMAAQNDHKLLLRQAERTDYGAVGIRPSKVPAFIPPGRGWHQLTGTETQVALLTKGSGQAQTEALREIGVLAVERDSAVPAPRRPFKVAELPGTLEFTDAYDAVPREERRPLSGLIGIGGDEAASVTVDLARSGCTFVVLGPTGSGRSNVLATLAVSLLTGGTSLVILTPRESPLRRLARQERVTVVEESDPSEETVRAALAQHSGPTVVMIDDADLLATAAASEILKEVAGKGRDSNQALIMASETDSFQSAMGGWQQVPRRARRGLLLEPRHLMDGELIGVRLQNSVIRASPRAGRGWMTGSGTAPVAVQVPVTVLKD
ncbi:FtsK/SpoIIIE domain-containing protein [Kribbella sp. NPDC056861]|uniref:FtsK/SpoIIIE domain-containing protein n=1 Tax=Kribbella sp. NPDC056861 TaxID=3154857 RepID=UPI00341D0DC5